MKHKFTSSEGIDLYPEKMKRLQYLSLLQSGFITLPKEKKQAVDSSVVIRNLRDKIESKKIKYQKRQVKFQTICKNSSLTFTGKVSTPKAYRTTTSNQGQTDDGVTYFSTRERLNQQLLLIAGKNTQKQEANSSAKQKNRRVKTSMKMFSMRQIMRQSDTGFVASEQKSSDTGKHQQHHHRKVNSEMKLKRFP